MADKKVYALLANGDLVAVYSNLRKVYDVVADHFGLSYIALSREIKKHGATAFVTNPAKRLGGHYGMLVTIRIEQHTLNSVNEYGVDLAVTQNTPDYNDDQFL